MRNSINHLLLFLSLSSIVTIIVGNDGLRNLLIYIPICLIITLCSFAWVERSEQIEENKIK
jgi:hypothetical protein